MGVYQEGESAYLVYSDNNCGISIDRLNDDYLSVRQRVAHIRNNDCQCGPSHPSPNYKRPDGWTLKGKTQVLKGGEEGPAIVKANEFYFLVTSWCSGWEPNQCHYRVSKCLEGPWNPEPDGYLGDDTSFKSQSGYILTITGNKGSTYINISDRWKGGNTEAGSTYPWLPLQINGSTMLLQWYDRWYLDLEAGTWSATKP
jgi:beta-xylosidase